MTPGVLVLAGPPCSGKSSVGRLLAGNPSFDGTVRIEVDTVFSLLLPESDRNRDDRMLGYDAAHALARVLLEHGRTPVLECTYARREQRVSLLDALAGLPEAPLWLVELFVAPDEAVRRFRERRQATDLDEVLLRERVENFPYADDALRVDSSSAAPADLAGRIGAWWKGRPAPIHRDRWAEAGRGWA